MNNCIGIFGKLFGHKMRKYVVWEFSWVKGKSSHPVSWYNWRIMAEEVFRGKIIILGFHTACKRCYQREKFIYETDKY